MPYRIEKFRAEHFDKFDARDEIKEEAEYLRSRPDIQQVWAFTLPIFTLLYNEEPILIYGMQSSIAGTYYPMAYAAKNIDKHTFRVVRCIYDYVEQFVGKDVRRFEAFVSATDKESNRLAKFFGFEPIGIRRQAAMDGGDQVIYERLWRK